MSYEFPCILRLSKRLFNRASDNLAEIEKACPAEELAEFLIWKAKQIGKSPYFK